jgi:hypothetical protein
MKRAHGKAAPTAVTPEHTVAGVATAPPPEAPAAAPPPRLTARRWRLALTAALFVGWLGYLLYLVLTLPRLDGGPVPIVSRPQLLAADVDVVAHVEGTDGPVVVKRVLWQGPRWRWWRPPLREGQTIEVSNLKECRPRSREEGHEAPADFRGPGEYLLPLRLLPQGGYAVAEIPASPGYPPGGRHKAGPPRIYPATPEVLAQERRARGG